MTNPPPSWYPDPTRRHELRYWDGSQWTDHVASAGVAGTDPVAQPPSPANPAGARSGSGRFSRHLGWVGLLLCVLAVGVAAVPGVSFGRAAAHHGVHLDGSTQHVRLPPHEMWGIYVDDANNSGYTEECSAVDANGKSVQMSDPSWNISESDTETLDMVFDTGSGVLTFDCSVPGERVTTRPVADFQSLLLGTAVAGVLGLLGVALIIVWLVLRTQRKSRSVAPAAA
ncbi:MAG: hypothetical protein JWQ70_160 [Aeromicrobium sp.]|nr:hypothetical protein [Aeromicrobium sp.]